MEHHLGLSGVPYSGPDIGGFRGSPSPEVYVRWLQLATFLGFCRTHSSFESPPREPWNAAPGLDDVVADLIRLRHRMLPYLYTAAWDASRTGAPLARPVWWPNAEEPGLLGVDDVFLLGSSLLVTPVVEAGARSRRVRLPVGTWFDWWEDGVVEGGAEIVTHAPLDRIPVFVRAGAVVPLEEDGRLVLHAWPDPATGRAEGEVYSDAGAGYSRIASTSLSSPQASTASRRSNGRRTVSTGPTMSPRLASTLRASVTAWPEE